MPHRLRIGRRWAGPLVLVATLLAMFAADRVLLRVLGMPIWEYDPQLTYVHRPNAVGHWGSFPGAYPLRTNRWGHADTDFPREKPAGEWRAVVLGDSVAMGFALAHADALPEHLERRLAAGAGRPVQVINAAVSGYGTAQYPEALRRALAFAPDLALIGFCLNDVLGPRSDDPRRSDNWLALSGVARTTNPLLAWVIAETGVGRLILRARAWLAEERPTAVAMEHRRRAAALVADAGDAAVEEQWRLTLAELDRAVAVARDAGVPLAVVVFPYVTQLGPDGPRDPQRRLAAWAAERRVALFDAATPLDRRVAAGEKAETFYLDELHFGPQGNAAVADGLAAWLVQQRLAPAS